MKKIIFYLLPVFLTGLGAVKSFAQDNYFSEARQINRILHLPAFNGAKEELVRLASGNSSMEFKEALAHEVDVIAAAVMVNAQHSEPVNDAYANTQSAAPPEGGSGQTVNGPSTPVQQTGLRQGGMDSLELRLEIRTILLLGMYDSGLHSEMTDSLIGLNTPHAFEYLDQISQINQISLVTAAIGNTVPNLSNFGFDQAEIIQGITDFVIKRAKEEMVEVYLKKWYETLKGDSPVVTLLIPRTLSMFQVFVDDHSVRLASYGDQWKAAFQEDLRHIPVVLQDRNYVDALLTRAGLSDKRKRTEFGTMISGGDELIYNIYLKKHLFNILQDMAEKYLSDRDSDEMPVFSRMVIASSIILRICGNMGDDNQTYAMVKAEDIKQMSAGDLDILLRLTHVRHEEALRISFGSEVSNFFRKTAINQGNPFIARIRETLSILSAYQKLLSGSSTNGQAKITLNLDEARQLFSLTFQLLDNVARFDQTGELSRDCDQIRPYFQLVSEIGEGVSTQQYGKVWDGALGMMSLVKASSDGSLDTREKFGVTIARMQKTGSFMVNILTSQTSEAVESALDELVPRGQYQLKNKAAFSVSLSAYPGIIGGEEMIKTYELDQTGEPKTSQPKQVSWKGSIAAYLPIGLDLNLGDKNHIKNFGSWNFFVQAIDLGAVLNYRLTGDSTESSTPDITFRQLFSPGLSVMRHFNNSPLVFGIAMNYTPNLRTVKQEALVYQPGAFRLGAFLSIDVTGLIIHSRK